jgi:putative ABC transport system permease protein
MVFEHKVSKTPIKSTKLLTFNLHTDGTPFESFYRVLLNGFLCTGEFSKPTSGGPVKNTLQDLRYAFRMFANKPSFTFLVIVTLALGIGANTAIFSVVNALLFRNLPYQNPEQLVMLWEANPEIHVAGYEVFPVSVAAFDDWRKQADSFQAVSVLDSARFALTGIGKPERVAGVTTSASFFELMGVTPILGRTYTEAEDRPGTDRVVVISYALWQGRFGGDKEICGKTMQLDGNSHTILGVMPQGFQFPRATDLPSFFQLPSETELWTPACLSNAQLANRGSHTKAVIARLKPGVPITQAQAQLDVIASQNEQQYPDAKDWQARVLPMKEQLVGKLQVALLLLLCAVGCVLLIACANVANLLLARAATRQKEIAIRMALGASRFRIMQQLLTESVMLALIGGGIGVLFATWGIDLLIALSPANIPRKYEIMIDAETLAFTLVVSLATGILFGLAPLSQVSRFKFNEAMKEGGRGSVGAGGRLRKLLVVAEVSLSLVLLISAGLLIRSFAHLVTTDTGFSSQNLAAMTLQISSSRYDFNPKQIGFFKNVLAQMRTIPGAVSVGAVSELPLGGGDEFDVFTVEGQPAPTSPGEESMAGFRFIDDGYFKTLELPLVAGRDFNEYDTDKSQPVVIISESLARLHFNGEDPIGKRVKAGDFGSDAPWATVVGVVKDLKHSGLDVEVFPHLYFPYQQICWGRMVVVVRSTGNIASLFAPMREAVWAVDKDQPITALRTMDEYLGDSIARQRFNAVLLAAFASLALILAAVGIYGVMSYNVTQRRRELGIRMALGARPQDIFRLVIGEGMKLALVGEALGLIVAFAATRVMTGLLFGVSTTDPTTFAILTLLLAGVAFLACYLPARRSTKVDPMVALHYE